MKETPPLVIVKVGGSLFSLPDLAQRLRRWLATQSPARCVLVAGGGAYVDALREQAGVQNRDEASVHWRCVDLMSVTASNLHRLLPELPLATDWKGLLNPADELSSQAAAAIFDCRTFLREHEPLAPGAKLPATWDATSDSIAARLAVVSRADRLVLQKSAPPPSRDLCALAELGYVDRFLPTLAAAIPPLSAVDLSQDGFPEFPLHAPSPSARGSG